MIKLSMCYPLFVVIFFTSVTGCSDNTHGRTLVENKILTLGDTNFNVSDSIIVLGLRDTIRYEVIDSANLGDRNRKNLTVAINSFTQETPDSLKEACVLAIAEFRQAGEISLYRSRDAYEAQIVSDLSTPGAASEMQKSLNDGWLGSYIIKR